MHCSQVTGIKALRYSSKRMHHEQDLLKHICVLHVLHGQLHTSCQCNTGCTIRNSSLSPGGSMVLAAPYSSAWAVVASCSCALGSLATSWHSVVSACVSQAWDTGHPPGLQAASGSDLEAATSRFDYFKGASCATRSCIQQQLVSISVC